MAFPLLSQRPLLPFANFIRRLSGVGHTCPLPAVPKHGLVLTPVMPHCPFASLPAKLNAPRLAPFACCFAEVKKKRGQLRGPTPDRLLCFSLALFSKLILPSPVTLSNDDREHT